MADLKSCAAQAELEVVEKVLARGQPLTSQSSRIDTKPGSRSLIGKLAGERAGGKHKVRFFRQLIESDRNREMSCATSDEHLVVKSLASLCLEESMSGAEIIQIDLDCGTNNRYQFKTTDRTIVWMIIKLYEIKPNFFY